MNAPRTWLPVSAFLLIGLNLRPGITSLATVLPTLQRDLGLGNLTLSLLTMLPVLCLGIFGPFAPRLAARCGLVRSVFCLGIALTFGLILRWGEGALPLFVGTLILAAAIGVTNVLMPALARANWPDRIGPTMGLFTMSLCLGAAAGAGLTAPLAERLGAHAALVSWAIAVLPALLLWFHARPSFVEPGAVRSIGMMSMLRRPRAWIVTGFMASQSSLAFVTFGWLPVMLQDRGFPAIEAGSLASLSMLIQVATALAVPALAARGLSQSTWALGVMSVTAAGFSVVLLAPVDWAMPGIVLLGLGQGGSFGLALTLIALRTADAGNAAALSSMVQSIGSLLAAFGPFVVGLLRASSGDWGNATVFLLATAILAAGLGLLAGRPGIVAGIAR